MKRPAPALLVPCHNAGRFLPRLMENVRAQTVPFGDILCYDDGSDDDTVAVARDLGLRILTPNANRGVSHARNRLAAAASAEWIHFHDADDLISPAFVEKMAPWAGEEIDVISCDADWIEEKTRQPIICWRYDAALLSRQPAAHLLHNPLGLNNSIIRRAAWDAVGGCDESLAMWEDADVHFRLARSGARFRHVPEVLTWSLRRPESFSHDYAANWRCRLHALQGYAAGIAPELRDILGAEAEKAAQHGLLYGDPASARQALKLARRLGRRVPTSRHPLIRLLRPFCGDLTLLRLQLWWRRHA